MRILPEFKIPDFKFPKFKMNNIDNIEEMKVDYEALKNNKGKQPKDKNKYIKTNYKTVKEIFDRSTKLYANNVFITEKFNPKGEFEEITYNQFREDVLSFGTALTNKYNLKDERIIIIGENTYHWYVSYMAMLCGVGVAVPVDKELPANEIENVVNRSRATAIIYSTKKKEVIKKIQDNLPSVKYFIQMNSDSELEGRDIGFNLIVKQGKELIKKGDNSFEKNEIDPEEFKVLIFTSGTTSQSKGVMICNRNLAENINAVSTYVYLAPTDRLFSVLPLHHTYESSIGFLLPFAYGASIAVCQGLKYIVPDIQETKPTAIIAVPLLIESIYKKINKTIEKSKKSGLVNSMIQKCLMKFMKIWVVELELLFQQQLLLIQKQENGFKI